MCILFLSIDAHPEYRLLLIGNRDEFYERPTVGLHTWSDHPHVRAGRDLVGGGSWLGVTDSGRFAAVTNYRDPRGPVGPRSRGELVSNFLTSGKDCEAYLKDVDERKSEYSGFNLIIGEIDKGPSVVCYYTNRAPGIRRLTPGTYGLSNALLDVPWPKVERGKLRLQQLIAAQTFGKDDLFKLLEDATVASDSELPDTGIGLDRERALSPIFIQTPVYGTRSSSVLSIGTDLKIEFEEREFGPP